MSPRTTQTLLSLALLAALAACGGGGDDGDATVADAGARALPQKSAASPALPAGTVVLPTVAPAPDMLMRESFGWADFFRPKGSKGKLSYIPTNSSLDGYWVEYAGGKSAAWRSSSGVNHWDFTQCTHESPLSPASPLEAVNGFGCVSVDWVNHPIVEHPTALLPFTPPASAYTVLMDAMAPGATNAYLAIGLTASPVLVNNFESVGQVWLSVRKTALHFDAPLAYEWRLNGRTGPLLASGVLDDFSSPVRRLQLRVDPMAQTVTALLDETVLGTVPFAGVPKYLGFEGAGTMDNFEVHGSR